MSGSGIRHFEHIDRAKIDMMLNELNAQGAMITGDNPWDIATHLHGITLRAAWSESTSTLSVSVTDSSWYIPRELVWRTIDSMMRHIQESEGTG
jgi:hypothetical protein